MDYQQVLRHRLFLPITVGAASFGAGAAAGVIIWKSLSKRRKKNAEVDLVETTLTIVDENQFTFKLWEEVDEIVVQETPENVLKFEKKEEPEGAETNVFVEEIAGWSYDEELPKRTPDEPYIIHRDEFYGDEMEWDNQQSLTWYEGDSILAMEDDTVVYNPHLMIGSDLRWGHGSGDPDIIFVRNERLHAEYEVTRFPGSFEQDVLGGHLEEKMAEADLKHSRSPGKFPRE